VLLCVVVASTTLFMNQNHLVRPTQDRHLAHGSPGKSVELSADEVAGFVRERFQACYRCYFGPDCTKKVYRELDILPGKKSIDSVDREMMNVIVDDFGRFVCSSPAIERDENLAKCNFEQRELSNPFCDVSMGKFLKSVMMMTLQHRIGMQHRPPDYKRFVIFREDERRWQWRPYSRSCTDNEKGWVRLDACSVAPEGAISESRKDLLEMLGKQANEQPTFGLQIFWQSVALRHVLERHIGPCLRLHIDRLISSPRQILPHGKSCNPDSPTIAMHVRRGDACETWAAVRGFDRDKKRPCFKLETYMFHAERMKQLYGACKIRLATDSDEVVGALNQVADKYGFEIYVLHYNRSLFKPERAGKEGFIEERTFSDEQRVLIAASSVADIEFLAQADFVIGTGASTITRLIHQLVTAYTGRVAPFISLDLPLDIYNYDGSCSMAFWY